MSLDTNNLPADVTGCHAPIAELVRELDVRDRRLRQMQHQLEQLLRWRYGQKSERIDENQLFFEALAAIQAQRPTARQTATRTFLGILILDPIANTVQTCTVTGIIEGCRIGVNPRDAQEDGPWLRRPGRPFPSPFAIEYSRVNGRLVAREARPARCVWTARSL